MADILFTLYNAKDGSKFDIVMRDNGNGTYSPQITPSGTFTVSGPLTNTELRAADVKISLDGEAVVLGAGTASIGGAKDNGPQWAQVVKYTTSADATGGAFEVSGVPTSGQKIVMDDVILSVGADMLITLLEETSGTVFMVLNMTAGFPVQITPRGKLKLETVDKKLLLDASAVGNVYCTCFYHSEA
jgi:hypothetical protein